jgi:hypothetical protein
MKLIRRILILITILLTLGTPYCTIIVLDALSLVPAPRYAHRLGFQFVGIAAGCIMLMMIYFSQNLRNLIFKRRKNRKKHELKSKHSQQQTKKMFRKFREFVQSETIAGENSLI